LAHDLHAEAADAALRRPVELPRNFFKPLIGAPMPLRDLPVRIERMITIEKLRRKPERRGRQVLAAWGLLTQRTPRRRNAAADSSK
jgi:hypothetical protein